MDIDQNYFDVNMQIKTDAADNLDKILDKVVNSP